jgi:hypothetical protein
MGARITRLSDDSAFTELALGNQPLDLLVTQLFRRVLGRDPVMSSDGRLPQRWPTAMRIACSRSHGDLPKKPRVTKAVMWSNHLNPESTTVVYEAEKIVRAGDPPTPRLNPKWRERMEDAIWALMLTPEFAYVP